MSIFLELSQEYEKDVKFVKSEIATFEDVFKTTKGEVKATAKSILNLLYKERDLTNGKAKFYREIDNRAENSRPGIKWR